MCCNVDRGQMASADALLEHILLCIPTTICTDWGHGGFMSKALVEREEHVKQR